MGGVSDTLLKTPVSEFLDRLADRAPAPGGGAAAALAGALASATARMVGAYSVDKQPDPHRREQVARLCAELARADAMLRRLVDEDAAAYERLSKATRAARDDPSREDPTRQALAIALAVPLEIAAVASNAIAIMRDIQPLANKHLLSDLGVAAMLADACVQAAAYSVRVNAAQLGDNARRDEVLAEMEGIVGRTSAAHRTIETTLPEQIRAPAAQSGQ
ncbi:MAG: cyclodeaminase/cyclohydrolase family protein [Phycisphaerales bacterium]|nr:MAG: cyclodeaminase/cyclohydrolase family protein [Phycisphaerales bacterium]